MGPVGLIATSLESFGATINENLQIIQDNEVIIDIVGTPWQNLKDLVGGMAKGRRMEEGSKRRNFLKDVKDFDNEVFVKANRQ